jgi:3-hydroxypropanoate dehydrogenase
MPIQLAQLARHRTPNPPTREQLDAAARGTLFTDARTANTFAATPVSDSELSGIWDLAKWAPTSANTQPLRILYVRPGQGRDRLVQQGGLLNTGVWTGTRR